MTNYYYTKIIWNFSDEKNMHKLVERKAFFDTYGIKSADLKN